VRATHAELGEWRLRADASAELLFCENETNNQRLFGAPNASLYPKDGINDFVVGGVREAVNAERAGTKVAAHHVPDVASGESASIRMRLTGPDATGKGSSQRGAPLGAGFDRVLGARRNEADQFYATIVPPALPPMPRW